MKSLFLCCLYLGIAHSGQSQLQNSHSKDSLGSHRIVADKLGKLLSWYRPEQPGAAFSFVSERASSFIKTGVPRDSATGRKLYFVSCGFDGPHMNSVAKFSQGRTGSNWLHNPACLFAGMVQSLAVDMRVYSGDSSYLGIVREMLDYMLKYGSTPKDWSWAHVPYASSDGGDTVYSGGTKWGNDGKGDGKGVLEPDKIGEMGNGYLSFFEITGKRLYLNAALDCASALATHIKDVRSPNSPFIQSSITFSPWPFRVQGQTNTTVGPYCSNVIEPIRLFDELIRIKARIALPDELANAFQSARDIAWEWLFSKTGPLKTYVWNGYFEDISNDSSLSNRVQITPLETARYFLKKYPNQTFTFCNVPVLLDWVKLVFGEPGQPAINEQTWCFEPMASHTARYASVAALWYEASGDKRFREDAYRYLNFASYMADSLGVVRVGPHWPSSWFSDGYSDYIRHFLEAMGSIPEWAPPNENHLLRSSSVIQDIEYTAGMIRYRTFDDSSAEVLRLIRKPVTVKSGSNKLSEQVSESKAPCWTWHALKQGGILKLRHTNSGEMSIQF